MIIFYQAKLFLYRLQQKTQRLIRLCVNFIRKNNTYYRYKLIAIDTQRQGCFMAAFKTEGEHDIGNRFIPLQDLIQNEAMLAEFSQLDVKALTFYAFYEKFFLQNNVITRYRIDAQEFYQNHTIYVIYDHLLNGYLRLSAIDLFNNNVMLLHFNLADIKNIIFTAIQEENINNLESLSHDSQYA